MVRARSEEAICRRGSHKLWLKRTTVIDDYELFSKVQQYVRTFWKWLLVIRTLPCSHSQCFYGGRYKGRFEKLRGYNIPSPCIRLSHVRDVLLFNILKLFNILRFFKFRFFFIVKLNSYVSYIINTFYISIKLTSIKLIDYYGNYWN